MNLGSLNSGSFPIDWILLVVVAAFIGLECFRAGPARAFAISLALPLALFLRDALSSAFFLSTVTSSLSTPVLQALLFASLFGASYFLIHKMTYAYGEGTHGIAQALLVGAAATAILASVWIATPALQDIWHFGTSVQQVFGAPYRFWWVIGAFATLAFARV